MNPLQEIVEMYKEGISGHDAYRTYAALALVLKDVKALADQNGIAFQDIVDKADGMPAVEKRHFAVTVERRGTANGN